MRFFRLILALILISQSFLSIATPDFKIDKSPSWKTQIAFKTDLKNFDSKGSVSYLLLDWQENELTREYNYRYCIRLNNKDGVQENSQLSFTFDPSYQELYVNKIRVHRKGKIINKLDRNKIELMRNERQADRYLYDGSYSAVAILEDIRVGDILEYEYTLKGVNPIFKDNIYSYVSQVYGLEITRLYHEILVPNNQYINVKNLFGGEEPRIQSSKGVNRLIWDLKNVAPKFKDDDTPSWFNGYACTEISSFKNWNEVRDFMLDLYPRDILCPKIDRFIANRQFLSNESGIIDLIRFVQDDIRYLAMSNGVNSHKPHHPELVFTQRFGDCKDKSYLLSVMLKRIGVKAWPAIVSTNHKKYIDQYIPSVFAFNHVIVKFKWKGKEYWVDPTSNNEKGGLDQIQNPLYGKALVIDDDSKTLQEIPENQENKVVITEDFWMIDSVSKVRYEVESKFFGELANRKRSASEGGSLAENMETYLKYCTSYYSNMTWQSDSALSYEDDIVQNIFTIRESYFIEDFWEHRDQDSIKLYTSFYPYNLYEFLNSTKDQVRTMPLKIQYPLDAELQINLHFPKHKELSFSEEKDSVVNDIFNYSITNTVNKFTHVNSITYKYRTLKDHVPVENLKMYFKDYDLLSNKCEYPVQWGNGGQEGFKLFGPSLILSLLLLILLFFLLKKLYYWNSQLERRGSVIHENIGGWLGLVALGLYATPIVVAFQIYNGGYFNQNIWDVFITGYNEMPFVTGGLFFFELLYNISLISASIFLIVLMHKKRTSFPTLYIYFRVAVVVGLIIDLMWGIKVVGTDASDYKDLFKSIVGAAIWIPYMLQSKRVEQTFINQYPKNKDESFDQTESEASPMVAELS